MELPTYPLFLALTRPAINRFGIPQRAWVINLVAAQLMVLWIGHGNPLYYLAVLPGHVALRLLTEWDHNFFRLGQLWLKTKAQGMVVGPLLSPLPAGTPPTEEIAGAV